MNRTRGLWLLLVLFVAGGCQLRKGKLVPEFKLYTVPHPRQVPPVTLNANGCVMRLEAVLDIEHRTAVATSHWVGAVDFEVTNPSGAPVTQEGFYRLLELEGASGARYQTYPLIEVLTGWAGLRDGEQRNLPPGGRASLRFWHQLGDGPAGDPMVAFHAAGTRYALP